MMMSNQNKGSKGNFSIDLLPIISKDGLPSWNYFSLKDLKCDYENNSAVLFDHYFVIFIQTIEEYNGDMYDNSTTLLAVDLQDNSVQEVNIYGGFSAYCENYSFNKYKDNQIIQFGGEQFGQASDTIVKITIESFQRIIFSRVLFSYHKAFSFQYKEIPTENQHKLKRSGHTAQIYQDHLYVYGGIDKMFHENLTNELWSFDLRTFTWKKCEFLGEDPGSREKSNSFIIDDNLCIYGGENREKDDPRIKDFFMLNLSNSFKNFQTKTPSLENMNWCRIKQQEEFFTKSIAWKSSGLNGNIYKDYLLLLGDGKREDILCCLNIKTNSWSKFDIQQTKISSSAESLVVYKNLLITFGFKKSVLSMAILNLESIPANFNCLISIDLGLSIQEPSKQKPPLETLFMNEKESDIHFKIQDKVIPAHKQVLIKKSRYFANLFKSGMVESRQEVIEIKDCEYLVFKEYLRFLYYEEVQFENEQIPLKLLKFTDKYLQNDLNAKCMDFLTSNLSSDNVYIMLDFSRQENIPCLTNWCMKFLKYNLTIKSVSGLVRYLSQQNNPNFAQENLELNAKALSFITDHYAELCQEDKINSKFYEDFLIQNINIDTIVLFAKFLESRSYERTIWLRPLSSFTAENIVNFEADYSDLLNKAKDVFEKNIVKITDASFIFTAQNFKQIVAKGISKTLPNSFLSDLIMYILEKPTEFA